MTTTNQRPTVETDAETYECRHLFDQGGHATAIKYPDKQGDCVCADFARRLEQQCDALRAALKGYMSAIGQGYAAHGLLFGRQQQEADNLARTILAETEPKSATTKPPPKMDDSIYGTY